MGITKILAILTIFIIALRWLIALLNLITGQPTLAKKKKAKGEVSVLIPARNEASSLPPLLRSLIQCDSTIEEILVYNDQSEDETASTVELWSAYDSRIRLIEGNKLPDGWTGKNYACYRLGLEAKGNYLLFLDADVQVSQNAIDLALSRIKKDQLALFSFFPKQEMHSLGEWILVSQVNIILCSLLPLAISRFIPIFILEAANGQFMMFGKKIYLEHQFHEKLRKIPIEDVAIAQYIKKNGLNLRTALAPQGLSCRMYNNYREALDGLSRSARFFFGGNIAFGWIYVLLSLFGWIPVLIAFPLRYLITYFTLLLTMRIFVSVASRQSVIKNIILMPLQQLGLFHLFITATKKLITGKTTWKGRTI
jgi:chlorobactene glucosyltransferase